jgi:anti-anti-sigma regulatory factor
MSRPRQRGDAGQGASVPFMAILLNPNGDPLRITLEGSVDIQAAEELKRILLDALGGGRNVCVSLAALTDLDVTAFQLLWAARRDAGASFMLQGPLPEAVHRTLRELGLGELLSVEEQG